LNEPYTEFAEFYDWIMRGVRYTMWAGYIKDLLKRFGVQAKDLLDLACGTGNSSYALAKEGFRVTGLDRSKDMLAKAKEKSKDSDHIVRFIEGDLRDFELDERFDVITCLFDSLNYLLTAADVAKAFVQVRKHLKPAGVFIFDVNTEYQLAKVVRYPPELYEQGDDVSIFWKDEWCPQEKIWRIHLDGFVRDGDRYRKFHETHEEKAYGIDELEALLAQASFTRVNVYDAYSFEPPRSDSGRLYFVCRT
jgi:SAM-dependent methyltransferase